MVRFLDPVVGSKPGPESGARNIPMSLHESARRPGLVVLVAVKQALGVAADIFRRAGLPGSSD
jgi:hypothetical protein